jgi:hypothetical protein
VGEVLFAKTGEVIEGEVTVKPPAVIPGMPAAPEGAEPEPVRREVSLPVYRFPHEVRRAAAQVFGNLQKEYDLWGEQEKKELSDQFDEKVQELLGDGELEDYWTFDDKIARWLVEKDDIQQALGGGGGGALPFPLPF